MYLENSLITQRDNLYTLEKEIYAKKHDLEFILSKIIENCESAILILEKCKNPTDNISFFATNIKSTKKNTNTLKSFSSNDIKDVNQKLSLLKTITTIENSFLACKANLNKEEIEVDRFIRYLTSFLSASNRFILATDNRNYQSLDEKSEARFNVVTIFQDDKKKNVVRDCDPCIIS